LDYSTVTDSIDFHMCQA